MAKKKRRGVTLFELLRKEQDKPAGIADKDSAGTVQPPKIDPVLPERTGAKAVATQPTEKPGTLQADEDGYIFHLTRQQMVLAGAASVVLLVMVLLIGGRLLRSDSPGAEQVVAQGGNADGERIAPLASLAPLAGSEKVVPDSPVRIPRTGRIDTPPGTDSGEPYQDGLTATAGRAAVTGSDTRLSDGLGLIAGLNYLVIQNVPVDAKPSPQEHSAEIRKFLASRNIRTIVVPAGGGMKVYSAQGFDSAESDYKDKCEVLVEKVRQAGKEYASAKYMGRYSFAGAYLEKYGK